MSASPSPRSTPAPQSDQPSATPPASRPTSSTTLPDRTGSTNSVNSFVPAWRRPTSHDNGSDDNLGRRPSVQFVPQVKTDGAATARSSSAQPTTRKRQSLFGSGPGAQSAAGGNVGRPRRMSSPPPPAQFRPSVSFDTFSNKEASDFSLTLNRKHRAYEYTKRSRTFLCGTDTNEYSDTALEWMIDELVDDGDEVVCLRVVEKDSREAVKWAGGMGERGYRREAERFLEAIEKKNTDDRAISLVLEFSIGKVHDTIQQMIRIYEPAILVVGTRGRSLTGYQGLLSSGSVSKYCLQYSPVPVIVVRPSSKREAKKRKRLQDPSRTGYRDILDKSEDVPRGRGGHLLDAQNRMSLMSSSDLGALGELGSAGDPDHEARMVAEAIGYRSANRASGAPLSRTASAASSEAAAVDERGEKAAANAAAAGTTTVAEQAALPPLQPVQSNARPRSPANSSGSDSDGDEDEDEEGGVSHVVRPEDEAAMLAYERALKVVEEEAEEAEERARAKESGRSASRNAGRSRSRRAREQEEDPEGGAAVLGVLAQLDRGIK